MVYVLDTAGKPLMPTERHGKVRRLLRDGKAHVVRLMPFTIQLDYESNKFIQEVSLGIDAGSVHIGVSATTEKKELFAAELLLRNDIVKRLSERRELRRGRRFRKTRHRAVRYDNRRKEKNWIAPSIRNKVDSHLMIIRLLHSILPISKTTIEVAQFDAQKIKKDKIQGLEYQQGEQMGFWNVREYVLARDSHKCQHCNGKSGNEVLNVHHLESRKTGGNAPNNLITLCETCHKAYHRGEFELKVKRGTSLRDAAVMNIMRWFVYDCAKKEFENVYSSYGYITKRIRIENSIIKNHCADAFCISKNVSAKRIPYIYYCRFVKRHERSLNVCKPTKGNKRRKIVGPHWIGKTKLQKYDFVSWNEQKCYIAGSTGGRLVLRDEEWKRVTKSLAVNANQVRFVRRKRGSIIISVKANV